MSASMLPEVPGDIRVCINQVVPKPKSLKTKQEVANAISALRKSEKSKTYCGRRLLKLYDDNRTIINSI